MNLFGVVFFSLAPALLTTRFVWRKPPWWLIVLSILIVGWAAWFLMVLTHFDNLATQIESQNNPSEELIEEWGSDGGPMVFAALFGWAFSLIYAMPWLALYFVAKFIRRLMS